MIFHLDSTDYAERLLGPVDWASAASVAGRHAKVQALLPSELVVLPVARIATAHLATRADLCRAVAARPAAAQPLRTLLADAKLRAMVLETLTRLQAALDGALLALGLPSPTEFATRVSAAANVPAPLADEDLTDDAAVYLADFLRAFATAPVGALVLGDSDFAAFDAPIVKVAGHYGWQVLGPSDIAATILPADTRPEDAAATVARLRTDTRAMA